MQPTADSVRDDRIESRFLFPFDQEDSSIHVGRRTERERGARPPFFRRSSRRSFLTTQSSGVHVVFVRVSFRVRRLRRPFFRRRRRKRIRYRRRSRSVRGLVGEQLDGFGVVFHARRQLLMRSVQDKEEHSKQKRQRERSPCHADDPRLFAISQSMQLFHDTAGEPFGFVRSRFGSLNVYGNRGRRRRRRRSSSRRRTVLLLLGKGYGFGERDRGRRSPDGRSRSRRFLLTTLRDSCVNHSTRITPDFGQQFSSIVHQRPSIRNNGLLFERRRSARLSRERKIILVRVKLGHVTWKGLVRKRNCDLFITQARMSRQAMGKKVVVRKKLRCDLCTPRNKR